MAFSARSMLSLIQSEFMMHKTLESWNQFILVDFVSDLWNLYKADNGFREIFLPFKTQSNVIVARIYICYSRNQHLFIWDYNTIPNYPRLLRFCVVTVFLNSDNSLCFVGISNTTATCLSGFWNGIPCQNRDEYLYYDGIHTTQAANNIFALNCFNGSICSPNVIQLIGA